MIRPIPPYVQIDHEAKAAYMHLTPQKVALTEEIAPGILIDYDANDLVVGVEFLDSEAWEIFDNISEQMIAARPADEQLSKIRLILLPAITEYREVKKEVNDPNYLNQYLGRLLSADPSYPLYQLFETLIND